jgi:hypothetical protein
MVVVAVPVNCEEAIQQPRGGESTLKRVEESQGGGEGRRRSFVFGGAEELLRRRFGREDLRVRTQSCLRIYFGQLFG